MKLAVKVTIIIETNDYTNVIDPEILVKAMLAGEADMSNEVSIDSVEEVR